MRVTLYRGFRHVQKAVWAGHFSLPHICNRIKMLASRFKKSQILVLTLCHFRFLAPLLYHHQARFLPANWKVRLESQQPQKRHVVSQHSDPSNVQPLDVARNSGPGRCSNSFRAGISLDVTAVRHSTTTTLSNNTTGKLTWANVGDHEREIGKRKHKVWRVFANNAITGCAGVGGYNIGPTKLQLRRVRLSRLVWMIFSIMAGSRNGRLGFLRDHC